MATQPVQLDFSKAQQIPIPKGATVGTVPIPDGATIGSPSPQNGGVSLDFSKSQPIQQQGELERFARGFNKAVTGAEDPGQLWNNLKNEQADIDAHGGPSADPTPILKSIHQGMQNVWNRATEEFKNGNLHSAQGLLNYLNSAVHAVESGVPILGPTLSDADQQLAQGNAAGAAGTVTGAVAPLVMGARGNTMAAETGEVHGPTPTAPPATSTARAVAAKAARAASNVVDPDLTGVISPRLAHAQRVLGKAADALQRQQPTPEAAPQATATVQLPDGSWSGQVRNSAPVEGEPNPQAPTSTVAGAAKTPLSALPSEDDVARGMGYKNALQAQQRLGPDQWKSTYQKIAAQPEVEAAMSVKPKTPEAVVDSIVPPDANKALNMKTKAEVNFYVQKGDVAGAKTAIQKAAMMSDQSPAATSKMFQPQKMTPAQRADLLDDKAVQAQIEAREGTDMTSTPNPNWKQPDSMQALISDATRRKTATSSLGRIVRGEEEIPLPGTPKGELAKQMQMPGGSPITDEDLTEILRQSVEAAKKAKQGFPKQPSPAQTKR